MTFGIPAATVTLITIYSCIFSFVLLTDRVPAIPPDTGGLNLEQGFYDLYQIATRPHPFISHENDVVRSYILSRLYNITASYPHVHIDDDRSSHAAWADGALAFSVEGNNILVKVDGSDPAFLDQGGVLFSAHFDSVSTAPGVTDDGIGVVTLMQLVEYFAKERQQRTAIFNINNGEEDGLRGSHLFLQHPWFGISDTFLNLEGAAAGGRPILFRSTSTAATRSFGNTHVSHPHGNVLSADAFAQGVIRSRTDFSIYYKGLGNGTGIDGLDFAFYQGRSKYHTKYDSMPGANGAKESLWAMMEGAKGAGIALLNDERTHATENSMEPPVYFDLFGRVFFVFTQHALLIFDVGLLVLGPLTVLFLHNPKAVQVSWWLDLLMELKGLGWMTSCWTWAQFWIAVIGGFLLQAVLVTTFLKTNKYVFHAHPYTVLTSLLSLAYLSTIAILNIINPQSPTRQRHVLLIQIYIFTWVLHLLATILVAKGQVGGFYFFTAWNFSVFLANICNSCERAFTWHSSECSPGLRGLAGTATQGRPTERTPLLAPDGAANHSQQSESAKAKATGSGWWYIMQLFLLSVPITLMFQLLVLVVDALGQTLTDGSNPAMVYGGAALLSFLTILPIAPFTLKIHPWVTFVILLAFIVSTVTTWTTFPFSQDAPLTVFFQQRVMLDVAKPGNQIVRAVTTVSGVPEYIKHAVVSQLPSSWGSTIDCAPDSLRPGLSLCMWETNLSPSPGGTLENTPTSEGWMHLNVRRLSRSSALFRVKGTNTRTCKLFFDSWNITRFDMSEGAGDGSYSGTQLQPGYEMPAAGFSSIVMSSRTWDKEFVVEVGWDADARIEGEELKGRVACEWAEYESAMIGGVDSGGKIPALEELLAFMPRWVVVSKTNDGLVEAWSHFML